MSAMAAAMVFSTMASIYASKEQSSQQQQAMQDAEVSERRNMTENQNAMVEEGFRKKRQARGLGDGGPSGNLASQSGAALTSVTGQAASII